MELRLITAAAEAKVTVELRLIVAAAIRANNRHGANDQSVRGVFFV